MAVRQLQEVPSGEQGKMIMSPTKSKRHTGAKRTIETARLTDALFQRAEGIKGSTEQSKRLINIKKEMLNEKKRKTRITDPKLLKLFLEKEQKRALLELEKEVAGEECCSFVNENAVAKPPTRRAWTSVR